MYSEAIVIDNVVTYGINKELFQDALDYVGRSNPTITTLELYNLAADIETNTGEIVHNTFASWAILELTFKNIGL